MKSYLRFLSRNKLYTTIEMVGLSIALAFVIILGAVLIDKSQVNDNIKDADEIYSLTTDYEEWGTFIGATGDLEEILATIPQIKEWCLFYDTRQHTLKTESNDSTLVIPMYVTPNFFTFFGFELSSGNSKSALQDKGAVVLSKEVADMLYPNEDPIGKTIRIPKSEDYGSAFTLVDIPKESEYIAYRITGVIDGLGKCVLPEGDIYLLGDKNTIGRQGCMLRTDSPDNIEDILNVIRNYSEDIGIIPFEDIKDGEIDCPRYRNIADPVLFKIFVLICVVILAFTLLNYISLTLAFSRFRLKEAATRSLLGTSKPETIVRCIAEAFILVLCSYVLAMLIVMAVRDEISSYLSMDIILLRDSSVLTATLITAFITSLIAGGINSLMNRRYRPIDVIRGESRYQDKSYVGKIFIGIQSAICLATVVVGMVISMQTRKMTDYPAGYNRHNIISVIGDDYTKYIPELSQMHFVEKVGIASSEFVRHPQIQDLQGLKWSPLNLDQNAFDMLGLKVKEYLELSGMSRFNAYTTTTGLELVGTLKDMPYWENKYIGVLEDFHPGSVKEVSRKNTIFDIIIKDDYSQYYSANILIKVSGDQDEAKEEIRQFFIEKGEYTEQMEINTLEELNLMNYEEETKLMRLMVVFSFVSLLLTALAIVALSSYYGQVRTHDTAVRKLFGISRKRIFWNIVWGFIYPVLVGAAVILPLSWHYMGQWLENYPERIDNSPAIYIAALAGVLLVTLAAISLHTIRLMRTNPAKALKKE